MVWIIIKKPNLKDILQRKKWVGDTIKWNVEQSGD